MKNLKLVLAPVLCLLFACCFSLNAVQSVTNTDVVTVTDCSTEPSPPTYTNMSSVASVFTIASSQSTAKENKQKKENKATSSTATNPSKTAVVEMENDSQNLKETKTNYSQTIKVLVSKKQREYVDKQLSQLDTEIEMLAKIIWVEAGGVPSTTEQSAVGWVVLNHADAYGISIQAAITRPNAFAWRPNAQYTKKVYNLSKDVITRWLMEKAGVKDVGRTIPSDYLYFNGYDGHNWFRNEYRGGSQWDWSLPKVYED